MWCVDFLHHPLPTIIPISNSQNLQIYKNILESDLQCIQVIHFISTCVSWDRTHDGRAAVTQCSTNQAT